MRLLGKVALGGGLASAATATWLVAAGVFATSATLVALDPVAPQAEAHPRALTTFDSCPALLDWYVDNTVKDVGPYGWGGGIMPAAGPWLEDKAFSQTRTTADLSATAGSATGTNTQETSVDEPDVAKTDGTLVARIEDDKDLVLLDVSGAAPRTTARLRLPAYGYSSELLLVGDHVLVTQQVYDSSEPGTLNKAVDRDFYPRGRSITRIVDIDISDPAAPRVLSRDRYTGRLLSARQYGDTVRLVTAADRPELDWTHPSKGVSTREATRRNRALVRATTIESWLPTVMRNGVPGSLVACEDVLHPEEFAGAETVVVTTFAAGSSDQRATTAITAAGGLVYSSADRLYLATQDYQNEIGDVFFRRSAPAETTAIHAFDLTTPETTYLGSGEITGTLRDRWSLDEYDGHLRAAWTRYDAKGRTSNGITVLTERDGALVQTAGVDKLGIDEDLQSVRWFDGLAVLVTFRQVDPLYTVDLSDPDHPKVLGALKIPGYSGYLHPIGDHLLLGLGMSGDEDGLTQGAQAAVFDISDPRKPVRVSQKSFDRDTYFQAVDDPRSFTWVPTGTAATVLSDWSGPGKAQMLALEIDDAGKLSTRVLTALNTEWQARSFALPDGRIAVLDRHRVRLISG